MPAIETEDRFCEVCQETTEWVVIEKGGEMRGSCTEHDVILEPDLETLQEGSA